MMITILFALSLFLFPFSNPHARAYDVYPVPVDIASGQINNKVCGNGIKEGLEQCDGIDGLTSENQWCCEGCKIHELPEWPDGQDDDMIHHKDCSCDEDDDLVEVETAEIEDVENQVEIEGMDDEESSPDLMPVGDESVEEEIPACSTVAPTYSEAEAAADCHPSLEEINDYQLGETDSLCDLEVYDYDEDNEIFFFLMADETLCTQSLSTIETGREFESGAGCSLNR